MRELTRLSSEWDAPACSPAHQAWRRPDSIGAWPCHPARPTASHAHPLRRRRPYRRALPWLALAACLSAAPCEGYSIVTLGGGTGPEYVELTTLPSTQPADTGTLKIDGKFIKLLHFEHSTARGIESFELNSPPPEVRLPAGHYTWKKVELQEGDSPRLVSWGYYAVEPITITAGRTTTLTIGGPLKPQVGAMPRGSVVDIYFSLTGSGGEMYTREDRQSPPRFTVTQDGRQIGAGTFEYG